MAGKWSVARDPNARRYLIGFAASMLGNSAMSLVAGIWVKALTGDNGAATAVSVCVFAPSLLAPLAGLLADRVRRRRMLVAVNAVMTLAMLPLLAVTGRGGVWLIFAVMLLYGASLAIIDPAETGLFTDLFDADARGRLNGVKMTLQEGGKLLAPPLGAALFAVAGGGVVAAFDALTFAVAAVTLMTLRTDDPRPVRTAGSPWRELSAGVRHLLGTVRLRRPVLGAAACMFVSGLGVGAQYGIVDALHRPATFLGVLVGLLGAGSIVGGLTAPLVMRWYGERALAAAGMSATIAATALLTLPWMPPVVAGSALRGLGLPWIVVAVLTLTQNTTGANLQGRVSAALGVLLFAPVALSNGAGAALITIADYRVILAVIIAVNAATIAYQYAPVRTAGVRDPVRTGR